MRGRLHEISQRGDAHPESVPGDLHHVPKRASAETENRRHTRRAVFPEQTSFHAFSIFQIDNQRDKTLIREMGELHGPMGLVKGQMMREIDKLKVRANGLEFLII